MTDTVYIGQLPRDITESDIKDLFSKFGEIKEVRLKNSSRDAPFAFVEYLGAGDGEKAINEMQGYEYKGEILKVSIAKSRRDDYKDRDNFRDRGDRFRPRYEDRDRRYGRDTDHYDERRYDDRRGGRDYDDRRGGRDYDDRRGGRDYDDRRGGRDYDDRRGGRDYDDRRGGRDYDDRRGGRNFDRSPVRSRPLRNSDNPYCVEIEGLPRSYGWREIKDLVRKAGDVSYANMSDNGVGVAKFKLREDMERVVKDLDGTTVSGSTIRVSETNGLQAGRSDDRGNRGRSVSPRRSRSRSRDNGNRGGDNEDFRRRNSRSP